VPMQRAPTLPPPRPPASPPSGALAAVTVGAAARRWRGAGMSPPLPPTRNHTPLPAAAAAAAAEAASAVRAAPQPVVGGWPAAAARAVPRRRWPTAPPAQPALPGVAPRTRPLPPHSAARRPLRACTPLAGAAPPPRCHAPAAVAARGRTSEREPRSCAPLPAPSERPRHGAPRRRAPWARPGPTVMWEARRFARDRWPQPERWEAGEARARRCCCRCCCSRCCSHCYRCCRARCHLPAGCSTDRPPHPRRRGSPSTQPRRLMTTTRLRQARSSPRAARSPLQPAPEGTIRRGLTQLPAVA
jgi:hypothetical protein